MVEIGAAGDVFASETACAHDWKYPGSEYALISPTSVAIVVRGLLLFCLIAESFFASCDHRQGHPTVPIMRREDVKREK
jgi:hypothetical protein